MPSFEIEVSNQSQVKGPGQNPVVDHNWVQVLKTQCSRWRMTLALSALANTTRYSHVGAKR
eukprot:2192992-Rhodomonas_salina.2